MWEDPEYKQRNRDFQIAFAKTPEGRERCRKANARQKEVFGNHWPNFKVLPCINDICSDFLSGSSLTDLKRKYNYDEKVINGQLRYIIGEGGRLKEIQRQKKEKLHLKSGKNRTKEEKEVLSTTVIDLFQKGLSFHQMERELHYGRKGIRKILDTHYGKANMDIMVAKRVVESNMSRRKNNGSK